VLGSFVPLRYSTDRTMIRIFLEERYENRHLPPGVRYASMFWTAHCCRSIYMRGTNVTVYIGTTTISTSKRLWHSSSASLFCFLVLGRFLARFLASFTPLVALGRSML
jgi:hypothetical protein